VCSKTILVERNNMQHAGVIFGKIYSENCLEERRGKEQGCGVYILCTRRCSEFIHIPEKPFRVHRDTDPIFEKFNHMSMDVYFGRHITYLPSHHLLHPLRCPQTSWPMLTHPSHLTQ
jgi:hypothetical protein